MEPVRIGLVGMGGYAGFIVDVLLKEMEQERPEVTLVGVCDPAVDQLAERANQLKQRGIWVGKTWEELLQQKPQGVWLPVPIHFHRPFTERALDAGVAVMCEKPAAGAIQDVDAMIAARDRTGLPAFIAFQDSYEPAYWDLKKRLQDGLIGDISHVTVIGCWARDSRYYSRNGWAGALKRDGTWVLDSPANNAMAHYINLPLYLLGPAGSYSAAPRRIEAELYRANEIENYDTCSMRIDLGGIDMLVYMTHVCEQAFMTSMVFHGSKGKLTLSPYKPYTIEIASGIETVNVARDNRRYCALAFARAIRGEAPEAGVGTIEMARAHTLVVNGASACRAVRQIPSDVVQTRTGEGFTLKYIPGIENVFTECAAERKLLHESGRLPWTSEAGKMDLTEFSRFDGPA